MISFLFGLYVFFLAIILIYNLLQLTLLFHYLRRRKVAPPPPLADEQLPLVTVQLPLYNEPFVAERLIDNIARMRYPRDRFEVQVLDDSTDETTAICERAAAWFSSWLNWRRRSPAMRLNAFDTRPISSRVIVGTVADH